MDALAGDLARVFGGGILCPKPNGGDQMRLPARPTLAIRAGTEHSISPLNTSLIERLIHETVHVRAHLSEPDSKMKEIGSVPKELEAYYVQALVAQAIEGLVHVSSLNENRSDRRAVCDVISTLLEKYLQIKNNNHTTKITRDKIYAVNGENFNMFLDSFRGIDHSGIVTAIKECLNTDKPTQSHEL